MEITTILFKPKIDLAAHQLLFGLNVQEYDTKLQ